MRVTFESDARSIGASNANFNPGAFGVLRLDPTAGPAEIFGISGGGGGRLLMLYNISSDVPVKLFHEHASAVAINRIITPFGFDIELFGKDATTMMLLYDGTSLRWRVVKFRP